MAGLPRRSAQRVGGVNFLQRIEACMKTITKADIVIFGGGIAGLWLLHRLRQAGYAAILFESNALGNGQTNKSQGIIHGGMKYALQGVLTNEAVGMADLPAYWRSCLQGTGEVDLSSVRVLSEKHYLWSPKRFGSKFAGMVASAALASKVETLNKADYPPVFQAPAFRGDVYALDEMVLDVSSMVRALVKENQDAVYRIEPVSEDGLHLDADGNLQSVTIYSAGKPLEVSAQHFVFTAGAGNEVIVNKLKMKTLNMQRRPLHMVLAKLPFEQKLFAHCLGFGPRPRITATTHIAQDGSCIWYLGGQLAEDGVNRDKDAQIKAAHEELCSLFPWLDFTGTTYTTFMIDRAEPTQKTGLKPESAFSKTIGNMTVAWPTKLALAPRLATEILATIKERNIVSHDFNLHELRAWPMPPLAKPFWEIDFCKNVV
jgi:glycerol-3-phosphate dehydrogenase